MWRVFVQGLATNGRLCCSRNGIKMRPALVIESRQAHHKFDYKDPIETIESPSEISTETEWKVPDEHYKEQQERLVYSGTLEYNVKRVKLFSLTTSLLGLACQPVIINKTIDGSTSKLALVFVGWTCLAVIFSPLLLHHITKRYVIRLTFNDRTKQFTATTLNFINRPKVITFTRDDVRVPAVPGMFTSFLVKQKPLLIDPSIVIDKEAYMHLMGYDRPIEEYIQRNRQDN